MSKKKKSNVIKYTVKVEPIKPVVPTPYITEENMDGKIVYREQGGFFYIEDLGEGASQTDVLDWECWIGGGSAEQDIEVLKAFTRLIEATIKAGKK